MNTTTKSNAEGAQLFQAKIAFSIPGHHGRDGIYGREYDDELIERLMDLFDGSTFETENICSPALLIVDVYDIPTPKWMRESLKRINAALASP